MQVGNNREPWKHQQDTFDWAAPRRSAALFLTMGLGKTAIAVNLCQEHRAHGRCDRWLIVAPLSVLDSWEEELDRCYPGTPVLNLTRMTNRHGRVRKLIDNECPYILVNYESAVSLEVELDRALYFGGVDGARTTGGIICDESTAIKNHKAQRTKTMLRLGELATFKYILTGTPVPQGPQDIFGQYLFLDRSLFGSSFTAFKANWCRLGGYLGKQILGLRRDKEEAFNTLLHSCAKRYTKEECTDMPPKLYVTRTYELNPDERRIYQTMADDWVVQMQSGTVTASNGLTKALRLAQICTGFVGAEHDYEAVEAHTGNSKLWALGEAIDELPEDAKFIVWCNWRKNVKDVMDLLASKGIKAVDYYGATDDKRSNELAFRNDPHIRGFVGTLASGGAGLNLQGPKMGWEFYFSQGYSVFQRQQSEDRGHRGAITHQVTIVDLVAKKTVEQSIVKALRTGGDLQDRLLLKPEDFVNGAM